MNKNKICANFFPDSIRLDFMSSESKQALDRSIEIFTKNIYDDVVETKDGFILIRETRPRNRNLIITEHAQTDGFSIFYCFDVNRLEVLENKLKQTRREISFISEYIKTAEKNCYKNFKFKPCLIEDNTPSLNLYKRKKIFDYCFVSEKIADKYEKNAVTLDELKQILIILENKKEKETKKIKFYKDFEILLKKYKLEKNDYRIGNAIGAMFDYEF